MQKAEPQHGQSQHPPAAKQGGGLALASPQGEHIAQLEAAMDSSPQSEKLGGLATMMNNSPVMVAQRKLIGMIDNSPRQAAQRKLFDGIHNSPLHTAQRMKFDNLFGTAQRIGDEEPLQGKFTSDSPAQLEQQPAIKPNNTGLPDNLKSGIENLSGMSMDNVKVHYNSSQPAQLNALAYAQGTDIHVAPGQEQHLPHEAWHVVQQAQGRVQPTLQMKGGIPVNDDKGLEHEADVMGTKASANTAMSGVIVQRAGLNSAKIDLSATGANVSKAPNGFSADRFQEGITSIHNLKAGDVSGDAGSITGEDVESGVRIDMQGTFNEGGKTFYNVQAQANDPVPDLTYPHGTNNNQKGTSLGAVHVEDRLADETQADVMNRTVRLLKSGLFQSIGDRGTHPRQVFKITYDDD